MIELSLGGGPNALLPPHEWPGCVLGYEVTREDDARAALRVIVECDIATMPAGAEAGLTAWLTIRRHAGDPALEVTVSCSLQGERVLGDPADAVRQYRAATEQFFRHVASGETAPARAVLIFPLDPALVATQETLFPLIAALTVSRPRPAARNDEPTRWERVRSPLAPWLRAAPAGPSTLTAWSKAAEGALDGYDNAGGRIRLARAFSPGGGEPDLWAVRWGGQGGIGIARGAEPTVAFAAQPFAAELLTGSAAITTWDEALSPQTAIRTYRRIDADAVFDRVLAILDRLMTPALIAVLARAEPDAAASIEQARHAAAHALAERLVPILAAHQELGDRAQAEALMEQFILSGAADPASMVVQVALARLSPSGWLRLGGVLSSKSSDADERTCAIETLLGPQTPGRLGFPVAFPASTERATLSLRATWAATDVQHLDDADAVSLPGRLALLLPGETHLAPDLTLGEVEAPLAARYHPTPARLRQQTASSAGRDPACRTLADFIGAMPRWSLALAIDRDDAKPEDDLWLALTFNRSPDRSPAEAEETASLTPLVTALLRFEEGYLSLAPRLDEASVDEEGADAAIVGRMAGILGGLASELARAFDSSPAILTAAPRVDPEEAVTWVWRSCPNADGSYSLFARGPDGVESSWFPTVAGCAPRDRGAASADRAPTAEAWREAVYELPDQEHQASLTFVWDGLDLTTRQTVAARASVVRNAVGAGFNPRLERTTGWAPLGPVLMPTIAIAEPFSMSPGDAPLEQALTSILSALGRVGDRIGVERQLELQFTYRYPIASEDGASELSASVPMLSLLVTPTDEEGSARIASALLADCRVWGEDNPLPRTGACWSMSAALAVSVNDAAVPLLTIRQLDLPIPVDPVSAQ